MAELADTGRWHVEAGYHRAARAGVGGAGSAQGGGGGREYQGRGRAGPKRRRIAIGHGTHAGGSGGTVHEGACGRALQPGTANGYRHALDNVLLPAFASVPLGGIGRAQVAALHYRLHKTPYMAEAWAVAPEGGNPCQFVKKYKDRSCERFLSEPEFRRLGSLLSEVEAEGKVSASAVAAFRLLMLTGCRRNEIQTLRWEDVDLEVGELRLRDAKTGARSVALSPAARKVLATLPRLPDNPWVIAGPRPGRRLSNLNARWLMVRARVGLEDVRIHDLRHSFASRALASGESLTMIGKLLGHRKVQTTARYAHLAQESVKTSAARVAESIAADMEEPPTAPVADRTV